MYKFLILIYLLFMGYCLFGQESNKQYRIVDYKLKDLTIDLVLLDLDIENNSSNDFSVIVEVEYVPAFTNVVKEKFYLDNEGKKVSTVFLHKEKYKGKLQKEQKFKLNIDTSTWLTGEFFFNIIVTNRPLKGNYIKEAVVLLYQKGEQNTVSNVETLNNIVWKNKDFHAMFPSLVNYNNGTLVTNFSTRLFDSHTNIVGGKKKLISSNNGITWNEAEGKIDQKEYRDKNGVLTVVEVQGINYEENKAKSISNRFVVKKYKNGKKVEEKVFYGPNDVKGFIKYDDIVLRNGTRLISLYGERIIGNKNYGNQVYFLKSVDGIAWEFIYLTEKIDDFINLDLSESSILELANGDILCMIRSEQGLYSVKSSDNGSKWKNFRYTGIVGYPSFLLLLPNDYIFCVYGYRTTPKGIRASISSDNGDSWDSEIVIRRDGLNYDGSNLGYPKATLIDNDKIFIIYYFSTYNQKSFIASSLLKISDIINK